MANPIEQCLVALTQLIHQNSQPSSSRARLERDIRFLPSFGGETGTLPSFIDAVTRTLDDYSDEAEKARMYQVIYDTKIIGGAKNLLNASPPEDWTSCTTKLKQHYRSSKDQMTITRDIGALRVSTISELDNKIRLLVENVTEYAAFADNGEVMTHIFCGMIVQKVKELVSGALAAAVMGKSNLSEIRNVVNNFIGQDQGNLRYKDYSSGNKYSKHLSTTDQSRHNNNRPQRFNNNQPTIRYNNSQSNQSRPNQNCRQNFNNSWHPRPNYQFNPQNNRSQQNRPNNNLSDSRQSRQQPQSMEVDTLSRNETNSIDDT